MKLKLIALWMMLAVSSSSGDSVVEEDSSKVPGENYVFQDPTGHPIVTTADKSVVKIYNNILVIKCGVNITLTQYEEKDLTAVLPGLKWFNVTDPENPTEILPEEEEEEPEAEEEKEELSAADKAFNLFKETTGGGKPEKEKDPESVTMKGRKLTLTSAMESNLLGNYQCKYEGKTMSYRSIRPIRVKKFPRSLSVTEGEDQHIHCKLQDPKPENVVISWFIRNDDGTRSAVNNNASDHHGGAEPHIKTFMKDGVVNSELKIEDAVRTDRNVYICELKTDDEVVYMETLVRVSDKYAALMPFLGIVVEVVLLSMLILFCEKRRKDKMEMDEDSHGNNESVENSNLRHRK